MNEVIKNIRYCVQKFSFYILMETFGWYICVVLLYDCSTCWTLTCCRKEKTLLGKKAGKLS